MKRFFGLTPMNLLVIVLVIVFAYSLLNNNSNTTEGFENTTAIVIGSLVGFSALIIIIIWAISRY